MLQMEVSKRVTCNIFKFFAFKLLFNKYICRNKGKYTLRMASNSFITCSDKATLEIVNEERNILNLW